VQSATRGYAQVVMIAARPTAVWRAFTDELWVKRWYAADAKVEPQPGGIFWVKLRDGRERHAVIDTIEVGKRMRLLYYPNRELPAPPEGAVLREDILFDVRPGRTMVRVLGSGVPIGGAWEGEYTRLRIGWAYWLHELKRLLEALAEP
jgi:uncharacterized protein YndB with AHSA1/START domain